MSLSEGHVERRASAKCVMSERRWSEKNHQIARARGPQQTGGGRVVSAIGSVVAGAGGWPFGEAGGLAGDAKGNGRRRLVQLALDHSVTLALCRRSDLRYI